MVTRILNIETVDSEIIQAFIHDGYNISITKRHVESESVQSAIYLKKEEAKALGEELIKLSEELIK